MMFSEYSRSTGAAPSGFNPANQAPAGVKSYVDQTRNYPMARQDNDPYIAKTNRHENFSGQHSYTKRMHRSDLVRSALTNTPQTTDAQQRKVRRSTRMIPIGMGFRLQ